MSKEATARSAMKLALEALEKYCTPYKDGTHPADEAITALREALAEPQEKYIYGTPLLDAMTGKANEALDKKAENARELGLDYEPAQEPVATVTSEAGNQNVSMSWWHEPALPVGTKLYTSPIAQRTWVGLTDEEVINVMPDDDTPMSLGEAFSKFARAIEAKLKEKNT